MKEEDRKTMSPIRKVLLAVLSGFLLMGSFPPFDFYPLAWIGLVPLLFLLRNGKKWEGALFVFLSMLIFFLEYLHWISIFGWYAWILSACYEALFPAVWGFVVSSLFPCNVISVRSWGQSERGAGDSPHRDSPQRIVGQSPTGVWFCFFCGFSFVAMEAVRNLGPLAMPWGDLAYTQWKFLPMIQATSLLGSLGISFILVLINAFVYFAVREKKMKWIGAGFLCLFLPAVFGLVRLRAAFPERIPVALLQTNDAQLNKWSRSYYDLMLSDLGKMVRKAAEFHPALVLFPETALPDYLENNPPLERLVQSWALQSDSYLGVGALGQKGNMPQNIVVLVAPSGSREKSYAKVKLVPFGEYLPSWLRPLRNRWSALSPIVDFKPGDTFTVFPLRDVKFGTMICFESSFGWIARKLVLGGADFLAVSTNDAWFHGTLAQEVHAVMGIFRAVETGRSLVQAGNTGISCAIDPRGRRLAWQAPGLESVLFSEVPVSKETTLYDRMGDLFPYACIFITVGGLFGIRDTSHK